MDKKETPLTHHILPTSSNLLGICFFVLSYIKLGDRSSRTLLDESVVLPIILFFTASVLSYMAMRSESGNSRLERMADMVFMTGLLSLSIIALILVFEFI